MTEVSSKFNVKAKSSFAPTDYCIIKRVDQEVHCITNGKTIAEYQPHAQTKKLVTLFEQQIEKPDLLSDVDYDTKGGDEMYGAGKTVEIEDKTQNSSKSGYMGNNLPLLDKGQHPQVDSEIPGK